MKRMPILSLALACLIAAASGAPRLRVPRAAKAPKIDGRLDEACWRGKPITAFRNVYDRKLPPPTQKTLAWVAWDDDAVYVAAKCFDDRMDLVPGVQTGIDAHVWRDECLEVFLRAGGPCYYHFGANLVGSRYDARNRIPKPKKKYKPGGWHADWRVAARRAKDHWTMEIAIPWACLELGPRGCRAPVRFNVGREERRLTEFSCWPASGFHNYEEYAVLDGVKLDAKRYGLTLKDVELGQRTPGPNRFSATIGDEAAPGTRMTVRARVREYPDGEPVVTKKTVVSRPGAKVALDYVVPPLRQAAVSIEFLDARGRVRLSRTDAFRVPALLEGWLAPPLVYVSDGVVRLEGKVGLPPTRLKGARLGVAVLRDGKRVASGSGRIDPKTGEVRAAAPLSELAPGRYALETRLSAPSLGGRAAVRRFPVRVIRGPFD